MELKSTDAWQSFRCLKSSNCTFMELKFAIFATSSSWKVLFKLYLYGIEMEQIRELQSQLAVQIVPLWNWNLAGHPAARQRIQVQIVPLWNWNSPTRVLNCTGRAVQIVPLWNWNLHHWMFKWSPLISSNCTFMELKLPFIAWCLSHCRFKLYLYGIEIYRNS